MCDFVPFFVLSWYFGSGKPAKCFFSSIFITGLLAGIKISARFAFERSVNLFGRSRYMSSKWAVQPTKCLKSNIPIPVFNKNKYLHVRIHSHKNPFWPCDGISLLKRGDSDVNWRNSHFSAVAYSYRRQQQENTRNKIKNKTKDRGVNGSRFDFVAFA